MTDPREFQLLSNGPDLFGAAARIYEQRHAEQYRYERERFAEWIDFGGEEGEA